MFHWFNFCFNFHGFPMFHSVSLIQLLAEAWESLHLMLWWHLGCDLGAAFACFFLVQITKKIQKNRRHILSQGEFIPAPSVQTIICFVKSTGGFSDTHGPRSQQNPSKVMTAEEVVWKSQILEVSQYNAVYQKRAFSCAYSTWIQQWYLKCAVFRNELLSLKCAKRIDEGIRYIALRVWILIWKGDGLYT